MTIAYPYRSCTVLAVLVCVFEALGQAPSGSAPNPAPVVSIPVTVANQSGTAITGLNVASFSLSEGSRNRSLESVREVAPAMVGKRNDRIVFIVLDATSMARDRQGEIRKECLQFLASEAIKGALVSLSEMDLDGVRVIHDVSTPSSILAAALLQLDEEHQFLTYRDQLQAMQAAAEDKSLLAAETGRLKRFRNGATEPGKMMESFLAQLKAFQELARVLHHALGRKTVIWLTHYFPVQVFNDENDPINVDSRFPASASIDYQRTVNLLNDSQVSIFPVEVETSERTRSALEQFAESTGGTLLGGSDTFEKLAKRAEDLSTSYYLLAFYPETITTAGRKWTTLKVRLNDQSLRVKSPGRLFVFSTPK